MTVELLRKFTTLCSDIASGKIKNLAPFLPLFFSLRNKPYTLKDHFVFEELYNVKQPTRTVVMSGRQVGKSTNVAVHNILIAATTPHIVILVVTPLFEQAARLSTMFFNPLLSQSPIKSLFLQPGHVNRVLQKQFANGSSILFSFAFLDATRVRGIPASRLVIDEVQSFQLDLLPIVRESISHSEFGQQEFFSGTPLTLDNTLTVLWEESSQAEWFIPCTHCTTNGQTTWNIPSPEFHLEKMIGPVHDQISEEIPGTICYNCRKPISPRMGRWVHAYPDRRWEAAGYHIPQIIIPYHCMHPKHWARLVAKQHGSSAMSINKFYNEVLGWPYDLSESLLSESDLKRVAILHENTLEEAKKVRTNYELVSLGIDWGGGGEEEISFTCLALCGLRSDGIIDVIWGKKLLTPFDHLREAAEIAYYIDQFKPNIVAHDYNVSGVIRETLLTQAGIDQARIMPMVYSSPSKGGICIHRPATAQQPRDYYRVDKARSLQFLCNLIRLGQIRFFKYDYVSTDSPGLIKEFLALREEKIETASGQILRVSRRPGKTCDFADATNYGCLAIWVATDRWPNLIAAFEAAY